jgi:hypothetical protein
MWQGQAWQGLARFGRRGMAGSGRRGEAWRGWAWQGLARFGRRGMAGPGKVWHGRARRGGARQGDKARWGVPGSNPGLSDPQFGEFSSDTGERVMNIRITLQGTSPLLMHNPQMVDPEFEINREIKALTSKRKKTDEDLKNIARLEWYGGLYQSDGVIVQPTAKARKCIVNTARISKLGKAVERAISFSDVYVPLVYQGPKNIDEIWKSGNFVSRLSVGVNGKRVMRVRPSFSPWAMQIDGLFVEDAGLNFDELARVVELAGQVEGIGDNRINGYGRFTGKVVQL